jgi:hypothetical protein
MKQGDELCVAAARNNAVWCDVLCRAHGVPGEFAAGVWLNRHAVPSFYPNLITLDGPQSGASHRAAIERLSAARPADDWAVKDSFAALDLAPLGFRLLFEASWIHRPAETADAEPGHAAHRVTSAPALARWERAWCGEDTNLPRQFPALLLAEPDHAIIALEADGAIIAGCIASRSAGVLGISNLFAPVEDDGRARGACLNAALSFAPGLPPVGYERGDDLARMKDLGFAEIGPLRVWQRIDQG